MTSQLTFHGLRLFMPGVCPGGFHKTSGCWLASAAVSCMVLSALSSNALAHDLTAPTDATVNMTDQSFVGSVADALGTAEPRLASDWAGLNTIVSNSAPGGIDLARASTYLDHVQFAQAANAPAPAPTTCAVLVDPYQNYACLDAYLGTFFFERLFNYYALEMGHGTAPADPNAPPPERAGWPQTPETVPPLAYTEFPTGALTSIGVTRTASTDSPLMVAISNTPFGQWMNDSGLQIYGWLNAGGNLSTNSRKFGNAPIAYTVDPNTVQLDQAVLYLERLPDTVQTDHFDWGFRVSALYGENYRYTNSYGIASWQFNKYNNYYGYDFPMMYVDLWFPQVFEGLEVRIGRYISIPDIEAQLAPNNIMYTHSLTYAWDNYTNTGIVFSWQVTKNWLIQTGITDGTETPLWHYHTYVPNEYVLSGSNAAGFGPGVDPLYPKNKMLQDPGNQPSLTLCVRYESSDGNDVLYPCLDGINKGNWGYNNIQWHGFTYYHKFNDHWHIDFESYYLQEYQVPNLRNSQTLALFNNGGTPLSSNIMPFNSPNLAYCSSPNVLRCNVSAIGVTSYLNYTIDPLNNISFRPEWYYDPNGWRTGTGGFTQYYEFTIGWQHWLSPQVEFRPEVGYWRSLSTIAFNGDVYTGAAPNRKDTVLAAADVIWHF